MNEATLDLVNNLCVHLWTLKDIKLLLSPLNLVLNLNGDLVHILIQVRFLIGPPL
jgi:hypothetical protein